MAYFSVGDIVTIREDLKDNYFYCNHDGTVFEIFTPIMRKYLGMSFKIKEIRKNGKYVLEGLIFLFTDKMFKEYDAKHLVDDEDDDDDYNYEESFEDDEESFEEGIETNIKSYHELEYGAKSLGKDSVRLIKELEKVNIENLINKAIDNKEYIENPNVFEEIIVKYNLL